MKEYFDFTTPDFIVSDPQSLISKYKYPVANIMVLLSAGAIKPWCSGKTQTQCNIYSF